MRLNQYINELFDKKPENWKIEKETKIHFKSTFNVDEFKYFMNAYAESDAGPGHSLKLEDMYWMVDFSREGANFEITKDMKSKAIPVFSGIKYSLEYFLKKYKPTMMVWTSDAAHLKLYKQFAKLVTKATRYKVHIEDGAENRDQPGKWFFNFWLK
jgi:hypothetical protein